jgi:hypothetical protein
LSTLERIFLTEVAFGARGAGRITADANGGTLTVPKPRGAGFGVPGAPAAVPGVTAANGERAVLSATGERLTLQVMSATGATVVPERTLATYRCEEQYEARPLCTLGGAEVAISARGEVVAVWGIAAGRNTAIRAVVRRPGSRSLGAARTVATLRGRNEGRYTDIGVDRMIASPRGDMVVLLEGTPKPAMFRPAGGSFRAPVGLGRLREVEAASIDPRGNVMLAGPDARYEHVVAAQRRRGRSAFATRVLDRASPGNIAGGSDPTGRLTLVWLRRVQTGAEASVVRTATWTP